MGERPPTSSEEADAAYDQLNSTRGLDVAWLTWSAGDVVRCDGDNAPVALCVDAPVATYRFVCTSCGNASPWFEVAAGEIRAPAETLTEGPGRGSSRPES